ncbi:unnamed protein product [Acanthoscelides obtectus]|uniref:Uncharacterized protein n=1 Tax=Acanthoscelides obtectus TaxID=200917 RepID=A0A9P0MB09_ACAOB|nr:unnamed protein product [Acanthoscelides obtectus]CAK1655675.1 hypothetical protein AOBTE_LOCUS19252 [Acanthoscelides obtectus]
MARLDPSNFLQRQSHFVHQPHTSTFVPASLPSPGSAASSRPSSSFSNSQYFVQPTNLSQSITTHQQSEHSSTPSHIYDTAQSYLSNFTDSTEIIRADAPTVSVPPVRLGCAAHSSLSSRSIWRLPLLIPPSGDSFRSSFLAYQRDSTRGYSSSVDRCAWQQVYVRSTHPKVVQEFNAGINKVRDKELSGQLSVLEAVIEMVQCELIQNRRIAVRELVAQIPGRWCSSYSTSRWIIWITASVTDSRPLRSSSWSSY